MSKNGKVKCCKCGSWIRGKDVSKCIKNNNEPICKICSSNEMLEVSA